MNKQDFPGFQLEHFKAEFFKALAHPVRISILDSLREGEKTVTDISNQFEIRPANASQHLAILRNRRVIEARRSGYNVYYSVSDPMIFKLLEVAKGILNNQLIGVGAMIKENKTKAKS